MPVVKTDFAENRTIDLSVVVPIFNPGDSFVDHVVSLYSLTEQLGQDIEIILVNDGSIDLKTDRIPKQILGKITLLSHSKNLGKGAALRTGFKRAKGNWIGFIDADGDIPAHYLIQMTNAINFKSNEGSEMANPDILISSKAMEESRIHSSVLRKMSSLGFSYFIRILFDLPIKDTQTGLKIFSKTVLDKIMNLSEEDGFLIDLELLNLAMIHGFMNIKEVPVTIIKRHNSTLSAKTVTSMLIGTVKLKFRLSKMARTEIKI